MARKLVSFQRILEVAPIEGADMIEKIRVLGWWLVTQKSNGFKVGDLVCYFEIDSFLPVRPEWEFLRKSSYRLLADGSEGFRIRTAKFRGQVSQGFALPVKDLVEFGYGSFVPGPDFDTYFLPTDGSPIPVAEGIELTDMLGVTKYDPPLPACLSGTAIGYIPSWMETDENRVQVLQPLLDRYAGTRCYVTEKLDGSSFTAFLDEENVLHVCSRNLDLAETEGNSQWRWVRENSLEEKLKTLPFRAAVQGEIVGEGIQGNRYKLKGQTVAFYNVIDLRNNKHLSFDDFKTVIVDELGLETVPILDENFVLVNNIDDLVKYSYGKTVTKSGCDREGVVIRPYETIYDNEFDCKGGRVSLKVINPDFLLKGGD